VRTAQTENPLKGRRKRALPQYLQEQERPWCM
jgi:hypothetical protein